MNDEMRNKVVVMKKGQIQFDMKKLEEAVHYICSKAADSLGAVKLNKILFYADMVHFAYTGAAITGAMYAKQARGPVPKQVLPAINNLVRAQRLSFQNVSYFDRVKREFTAFGETDISVFSKEEIERLDDMIRFLDDIRADELSDISHTIVWKSAEMGETLPYESFFISYLGDITDDDIVRVQASIKAVEHNSGHQYA